MNLGLCGTKMVLASKVSEAMLTAVSKATSNMSSEFRAATSVCAVSWVAWSAPPKAQSNMWNCVVPLFSCSPATSHCHIVTLTLWSCWIQLENRLFLYGWICMVPPKDQRPTATTSSLSSLIRSARSCGNMAGGWWLILKSGASMNARQHNIANENTDTWYSHANAKNGNKQRWHFMKTSAHLEG